MKYHNRTDYKKFAKRYSSVSNPKSSLPVIMVTASKKARQAWADLVNSLKSELNDKGMH